MALASSDPCLLNACHARAEGAAHAQQGKRSDVATRDPHRRPSVLSGVLPGQTKSLERIVNKGVNSCQGDPSGTILILRLTLPYKEMCGSKFNDF